MTGLSQITSALDFSAVSTGIISIAVALSAVLVVRKGAKMLLGFLR